MAKVTTIRKPTPPRSALDIQINLVYMMAMAQERMIDDIERQLRQMGTTFNHEKKQRFNNIIRACEAVKKNADIIDQTDYAEGLKGKEDVWMGYYENGLFIDRVLLLLCDRIAANPEVYDEIQRILREKKGSGLITEKDIDRFYTKKIL